MKRGRAAPSIVVWLVSTVRILPSLPCALSGERDGCFLPGTRSRSATVAFFLPRRRTVVLFIPRDPASEVGNGNTQVGAPGTHVLASYCQRPLMENLGRAAALQFDRLTQQVFRPCSKEELRELVELACSQE